MDARTFGSLSFHDHARETPAPVVTPEPVATSLYRVRLGYGELYTTVSFADDLTKGAYGIEFQRKDGSMTTALRGGCECPACGQPSPTSEKCPTCEEGDEESRRDEYGADDVRTFELAHGVGR